MMSRQIPSTLGATEWFLLWLLSALWGGSFFFVELALEGFLPFTVVFVTGYQESRNRRV